MHLLFKRNKIQAPNIYAYDTVIFHSSEALILRKPQGLFQNVLYPAMNIMALKIKMLRRKRLFEGSDKRK